MKSVAANEIKTSYNLSRTEWLILGLLLTLLLSFNLAEAGPVYVYEEGQCQMIQMVGGKAQVTGVDIIKCGFGANPNHTEWDVVGGKCKKVYVYLSSMNSQWNLRKTRPTETFDLKECGYDLNTPKKQSIFYEAHSQSCRKRLIYTSALGLEDLEVVTEEPNRSKKLRQLRRVDRRIASQTGRSICR
ncbi:MAG: hypothetical protein IT288_05250 [Bdellovibrionales bacterium]|nr:hypothetical protein [Bdellovibrionales bacterium]